MTEPMFYILLNCAFILSQMFPMMLKPKEICNFNQGSVAFY